LRVGSVVAVTAILGASVVIWAVRSDTGALLHSTPAQSPVATALSWFKAVDARNMPLARAHFAPQERFMMSWGVWPHPFTHLRCSPISQTSSSAEVDCSFDPQNDSATGMGNESFWTVYFQHDSSGRWLINSYGQG